LDEIAAGGGETVSLDAGIALPCGEAHSERERGRKDNPTPRISRGCRMTRRLLVRGQLRNEMRMKAGKVNAFSWVSGEPKQKVAGRNPKTGI
jgi:hypothetical protein